MLASQHDFMFFETSAFASENVSAAFETLLNNISEVKKRNYANGQIVDKSRKCLKLNDPELEDKGGSCC